MNAGVSLQSGDMGAYRGYSSSNVQKIVASKISDNKVQSAKPKQAENPYQKQQIRRLADNISKTQLYTKDASTVIAENLLKGKIEYYV